MSNIICKVRLYYWKFRDRGSKFSHETAIAGCLRPSATIMQSLTHKRTLINIGPKEKTLHSNISDITSNC